MALGDPAAAEVDARRQLTGSDQDRADGMMGLALLDLYWGRFAVGLQGLLEAADLYDRLGLTQSGSRARDVAARNAWQLGQRDLALDASARAAGAHAIGSALAGSYNRIIAGKLDEARERARLIPEDSVERITAELWIARAAGDPTGVLAAYERLAKTSTTIDVLYDAGDALERAGRLDDAAAVFERLATSPRVWSEPIAGTRAWYRLGLLRERGGDRSGARTAFAAITARWAGATEVTPELADARRHVHALDAGPSTPVH
jgi:hypothetical protein